MKSIQSKLIGSVGYDKASQVLQLQYNSGATYRYKNVPQITYDEMMSASSVGAYVMKNIAHKFDFDKIGG